MDHKCCRVVFLRFFCCYQIYVIYHFNFLLILLAIFLVSSTYHHCHSTNSSSSVVAWKAWFCPTHGITKKIRIPIWVLSVPCECQKENISKSNIFSFQLKYYIYIQIYLISLVYHPQSSLRCSTNRIGINTQQGL